MKERCGRPPQRRMLGIERDAVKWEAYAGAHKIQEGEILVITHYLQNLGVQVCA